jgi:hypothetical protein
MFAPLQWVHLVLFDAIGGVRPFDAIMAVLLIMSNGKKDAKGPRVMPMRTALIISGCSLLFSTVYGLATGGNARYASWQVYLLMSGILVAFTVASAFRTAEHYTMLAKMIIASAMYRAVMCWIFYVGWVRNMLIMPWPEYLTSHDDSVLWVVALLILFMFVLETKKKALKWRAFAAMFFIIMAMQFNQRRLAWVSLAMGLMLAFYILRTGPVKRTVNKIVRVAVPVVVLYVAVGWGRSERVFKPLRAFATVSTQEDASTKARNVENLGLIATVASSNWLTGTGYGHGYIELSNKYSIAQYFELWRYIPHNSILGMLAYTGIFGVSGYWICFPTGMFLNARVARLAPRPEDRALGLVGAAQMIVCANQMYGDMGLFSMRSVYIMAGSYAIAMRMPVTAGVWPGGPRPKGAAQAA